MTFVKIIELPFLPLWMSGTPWIWADVASTGLWGPRRRCCSGSAPGPREEDVSMVHSRQGTEGSAPCGQSSFLFQIKGHFRMLRHKKSPRI